MSLIIIIGSWHRSTNMSMTFNYLDMLMIDVKLVVFVDNDPGGGGGD